MPKVSFAQGAPQEAPQEMPQEPQEAQEQPGNPDEAIKAGLAAILQSQDINEVHQIAQALMGAAEQDMATESPQKESLSDGVDKIFAGR